MRLVKTILWISLIAVLSACNWADRRAEDLTIPLRSYNGTELRTNGYYYWIYENTLGQSICEICFLYRNGVILYGGAHLMSELPEVEASFTSGEYDASTNNRTNWGRFEVIGNYIRYQRWFPSSGGPAPVYLNTGVILNDTLFHLTHSRKVHGEDSVRSLDEYYHFKELSPKPDSTNSFTN